MAPSFTSLVFTVRRCEPQLPSISNPNYTTTNIIPQCKGEIQRSTLREGLGGKLLVECTGEGVMFIEADAVVSLEQFGHAIHPPFLCMDELLMTFLA
ncbi:benzyl alcohol o-benzoyltransferase [Quercus suber]|uniref:Benzyl alcohol o-benzoyltransferase n=1 Tax=Quercus suber TaxID=58331 RepID=A0AAW0JLB0_QUESU